MYPKLFLLKPMLCRRQKIYIWLSRLCRRKSCNWSKK